MSKAKQTKLKVVVLEHGQKLPKGDGWKTGDRHSDLKHLVHLLANHYDPAAERENRPYSIHTARLIQNDLEKRKRAIVPSDRAILFQLNTADNAELAIKKGSNKMGYYSQPNMIESKKAIVNAAKKK
jgi:hypothetical protein